MFIELVDRLTVKDVLQMLKGQSELEDGDVDVLTLTLCKIGQRGRRCASAQGEGSGGVASEHVEQLKYVNEVPVTEAMGCGTKNVYRLDKQLLIVMSASMASR